MNIIRLPGLIDIHVHFRDPGETHKEDFKTGSSAAVSGGITTVFDMPNNLIPIFTPERLNRKLELIRKKGLCNIGLYFGTDGNNTEYFQSIKEKVIGLKIYMSLTTGKYLLILRDFRQ